MSPRAPITFIDDGRSVDPGASDEQFLQSLGGPTLLRIAGRDRSRVRAVTTLLHGNEPSGLRAMRAWLSSGVVPAVDALLYVGSVEAALGPPLFGHRALVGHRDANRCFVPPFEGVEGARARALLSVLESDRPEALVDLHNNTGHSPAYGVGIRLDPLRELLTSLFADRYMLSDLRLGTLVEAVEEWFPSVVIECGRAGDPIADAVALAGLERFLSIEQLDAVEKPPALRVLEAPVRVVVRPDIDLVIAEAPSAAADLTVRAGIDRHNFEPIGAGVVIGWLGGSRRWPFEATGASGDDVSRELFVLSGDELRTRREMVPIMMTTSAEIAKRDCLFYAMRHRRR